MFLILWLIAGCAIVVIRPPPVEVAAMQTTVPMIAAVVTAVSPVTANEETAQALGAWSCGILNA